jgi:hypothetical protein
VNCVRYADGERRKDEGPGRFLERTPGLLERARFWACVHCIYALIARRCPVGRAGAMRAHETTYRLYSCARCAAQVRICRRCDRGNRYCAGACSRIRRRESLHRAGARYQRSHRGARRHAARQGAWRSRRARKVTHQGSSAAPTTGTVTLVATDETLSVACDDPRMSESPPLWRTEHRSLLAQRCSLCGDELPAFARFGPLRGGP